MKRLLFFLIIIIFAVNPACRTFASDGTGLGIQGDLLPQSFSESFPEKSEKLAAFERELFSATGNFLQQNDMRLTVAAYCSQESIGISPTSVGNNIEAYADNLQQKEMYGAPAANFILLVYIESTNEFTYRTSLQKDFQAQIDFKGLSKVFTEKSDIKKKLQSACNLIVSGNSASNKTVYIIIIIATLLAVIVIIIVVSVKKKNRKRAETEE